MSIEGMIRSLVDDVDAVQSVASVGGGCISEAAKVCVRLADQTTATWFVKVNEASFAENFACEENGLQLLRSAGVVRIPDRIGGGLASGRSMLILEWIDRASARDGCFGEFGRQLATLHQRTSRPDAAAGAIGLDHDNFLGATPQINSPAATWSEFVAEHRIGFQLRRAVDLGRADQALRRDVTAIVESIDDLMTGRDRQTSLLHGDLWSGNYWFDVAGRAVLIDPAVYHGCREAEFGMIRLFGGCPPPFYDAYQDTFPMADGWQRRTSVYVLYHLLNHLNLFGSSYLSQCKSVAAEILS